MKATVTLANGDMRRALNILQVNQIFYNPIIAASKTYRIYLTISACLVISPPISIGQIQ